jgi:hypothetical protein
MAGIGPADRIAPKVLAVGPDLGSRRFIAGAVVLAACAGALASFGGTDGELAGAGVVVASCLVWLRIETLVGLWLVIALADPALPELGGLNCSDFVLLIAVAKLAHDRPRLHRLPPRTGPILALAWLSEAVVTVFGHTVTSENPRFLVTLAGLNLAAYIVWASPRPAPWIRWLALSSGVAAILAVAQWTAYRVTGVVIFPTAQNLFFIRTEIADVFKATGLGIDPNFLGMWIVPGVGIAVIGFLRTKRRLEYVLFGVLCALGILATGSRGSLVSAIIGAVIVVFVESASPRRTVSVRRRRIATAALVIALLTPAMAVEIDHAIARYPVTVDTRVNQIPAVLHAAVSGNWAGMGFEAEAAETTGIQTIQSPFLAQENVVHNTLLEALYEAGWLGFLVPLAMLVTGLLAAVRLVRGPSPIAAMIGAGFIVLSVNLQVLGAYAFRPFWFIWALLLAVDAIARAEPSSATPPTGGGQASRPLSGLAVAPPSRRV